MKTFKTKKDKPSVKPPKGSPQKKSNEKNLGLTPDSRPKAAFNWFPGHMLKAMREVKNRLKVVDLVVEVRDARVPLVSGNRSMTESIGQKSRLILLNKVNLADPEMIKKWEAWFEKQGEPYLFVDCFDKAALKKLISMAKKVVEEKRLQSNPDDDPKKEKLRLMIVGLPNTGKSTIINQLSGKSIAKTADKPGQTTVQQWIKVDDEVDLLDTPGIMPPQIDKEEHGLWLSAIHAIPDHITSEEDTACYLVNYFFKRKSPEFFERYKLDGTEPGLNEILEKIGKNRGFIKQKGEVDYERVFRTVILDFRRDELGKSCFGEPRLV